MSYDLSGLKRAAELDGPTLAIFLGKIETWNDPAIKSFNASISLPSTSITVVHPVRLVGNDEGLRDVPVRLQPGLDGHGAASLTRRWVADRHRRAGRLRRRRRDRRTPGAIGYVEQAYALQNG